MVAFTAGVYRQLNSSKLLFFPRALGATPTIMYPHVAQKNSTKGRKFLDKPSLKGSRIGTAFASSSHALLSLSIPLSC